MLDSKLRPLKDVALTPLLGFPVVANANPLAISALGLAAALAAATAAWQGLVVVSVGLWLLGRTLDGLDGLVARTTGRQSDTGGVVDFLFDSVGYAAVPLGLAAGQADDGLWIVTAILIASFYLNAVSLGQAAAVLEKRALGAAAAGQPTSTTLPRGLVEGTETVIAFTLALAAPGSAVVIWSIMALAVVLTAIERTRWLTGQLSDQAEAEAVPAR